LAPSTFAPTPSIMPTLEPTMIVTNQPSLAPSTFAPTPDHSVVSGCETAYVYCPGRSTCLPTAAWGWNIDLNGVDLSGGKTLTCDVYAGAAKCNLSAGILVGAFVIGHDFTRWEFSAGNGGSEFHLYGGKCQFNDGGDHLVNGGTCTTGKERTPGSYSLITGQFNPLVSNFQFDTTNDFGAGSYQKPHSNWATAIYKLFPLVNDASRRYLSAHAGVCPCKGSSCVSGSTMFPTLAPKQASESFSNLNQPQPMGHISGGPSVGCAGAIVAAVSVIVGAMTLW
jgi:hypothetical protein